MLPVSPISTSSAGLLRAFESTTAPVAPASGGKASPSAEVKRAAQQFEAILLRQLLAPVIEPMMNGSLGGSAGGAGGGVYGFMLTETMANAMSQGGGLGLASVLEKQFSTQNGSSPPPVIHENII